MTSMRMDTLRYGLRPLQWGSTRSPARQFEKAKILDHFKEYYSQTWNENGNLDWLADWLYYAPADFIEYLKNHDLYNYRPDAAVLFVLNLHYNISKK